MQAAVLNLSLSEFIDRVCDDVDARNSPEAKKIANDIDEIFKKAGIDFAAAPEESNMREKRAFVELFNG